MYGLSVEFCSQWRQMKAQIEQKERVRKREYECICERVNRYMFIRSLFVKDSEAQEKCKQSTEREGRERGGGNTN